MKSMVATPSLRPPISMHGAMKSTTPPGTDDDGDRHDNDAVCGLGILV